MQVSPSRKAGRAAEALPLATAFNEYFLNEFLSVDSRYKLAMAVAAHDPAASATEIRRLGAQPGIVPIFLLLLNILAMIHADRASPLETAMVELKMPQHDR